MSVAPKPPTVRLQGPTFVVPDGAYSRLVGVGWAAAPADRLCTRLAALQPRFERQTTVSAGSNYVALFLFVAYTFTKPLFFGSAAGLVVLAVVLAAVIGGLYLIQRSFSIRSQDYAIAYLITGLTEADRVVDDPRDHASRARLAAALDAAARNFLAAFRKPGATTQSRTFKRELESLAREGAEAILKGTQTALGDEGQVRALRDDLARAILRIDAGDWMAVRFLKGPGDSVRIRRFTVASAMDRISAALVIAVLGFLTALFGLIAKVVG